MGSGSQITKGVGDVILLKDEFGMLPRAIAEGRRIARNIHRLGRLYLTKSVYAAFLITVTAIFGFTFPFLPRHLTVAALLTIGIPSFVLALAPSEGPLYRGRLLKALAAFAVPAGLACGVASLLSFFLVDNVFGGIARRGEDGGHDHADRARPVLHPPARARAGPRAHHDPELHAGDDRRAGGPLRPDPGDPARARLLRARPAHLGTVVPGARVGRRRPAAGGGGVAAALHPAPRGRPRRASRARSDGPAPTHRPRTGEQAAVPPPEPGPPTDERPTKILPDP